MKKLKTLEQTTWEEIKDREIFAIKGCWTIMIKIGNSVKVIETDILWGQHRDEWSSDSFSWMELMSGCGRLYKLSESIQSLWLEK